MPPCRKRNAEQDPDRPAQREARDQAPTGRLRNRRRACPMKRPSAFMARAPISGIGVRPVLFHPPSEGEKARYASGVSSLRSSGIRARK